MNWTVRNGLDPDTVEEIDRQEDRAAAIIAGAYLEDFVADAIKTRLLSDEQVINDFFNGMGPLATFSAKIEMAYLLNVTTKECRQVMHIVRKVRNEFAHNLSPVTFETPRIKDMCRHLVSPEHVEQFMENQLTIELKADSIPELVKMMEFKLSYATDARSAYINAVKVITFCLAVGIS